MSNLIPNSPGGKIVDLKPEEVDDETGYPVVKKLEAESPSGDAKLEAAVVKSEEPVGTEGAEEDDLDLEAIFSKDPMLSAIKKMGIDMQDALTALRAVGKKPSMGPTDPNEGNTVSHDKGPKPDEIPPAKAKEV